MINRNQNETVRSVRDAIENLLELVGKTAMDKPQAEMKTLCEEAEGVLLSFIASIITSDGRFDEDEQAFIAQLVDYSAKPNGELSYLRIYTELWKKKSAQVPRFFQIALDYDAIHRSDCARDMLLEIQLVGNNSSVSGRTPSSREQAVVNTYLRFLDRHLERERGENTTWLSPQ